MLLNASGCLDALTAPDVARALDAFVTKVSSSFSTVMREEKLDEMVQQSFPASDPPPGPAAIGRGTADEARA